jgi:hypothetical protein
MIKGQPSSLSFGPTVPLSFSLHGWGDGGVFLLTIEGYLITIDGKLLTIQ